LLWLAGAHQQQLFLATYRKRPTSSNQEPNQPRRRAQQQVNQKKKSKAHVGAHPVAHTQAAQDDRR
jgi:hypothetical protein